MDTETKKQHLMDSEETSTTTASTTDYKSYQPEDVAAAKQELPGAHHRPAFFVSFRSWDQRNMTMMG